MQSDGFAKEGTGATQESTGISGALSPDSSPIPSSPVPGMSNREALKAIFAELRKEGLAELGDADSIFEVKGQEPSTRFFRRFGSSTDRLMFGLLRIIAILDVVYVLPMLCFGDIMRVGLIRRYVSLRVLESLTALVYFYGVLLRFFTSIVDVTTGTEYVELAEIFHRHVNDWTLWADALSLAGHLWWVWPDKWFISGLRLLRTWRLSSGTNYTYLIISGRTESPSVSVCELVVALWLVAHIFGCLWFYIDTLQLEGETNELEAHTVTKTVFKKEDEIAEQVLSSFVHDAGVTYLEYMKDGAAMLVGWNGPEPSAALVWSRKELIFWIFVAPSAAMYMTMVFGWLLMLVERIGMSDNKHSEMMANLGSILHTLKAPDYLKKRILQHHAYLNVHNIDASAYEVLFTGLSSNLHVETKLFLFESLVLSAPFFEDVPPQYLMQLVSSLEEAVFSPGDMIVQKGQVGEELFFIIKGSVDVLIDDMATVIVAVKHMGEYFGEIALVLDQARSAWIRAKTFCVLAKLMRSAFEHVLDRVPEVKQKMIDKIMVQCKQIQAPKAPPVNKVNGELEADLEKESVQTLKAITKVEGDGRRPSMQTVAIRLSQLSPNGQLGVGSGHTLPGLKAIEQQICGLFASQADIEDQVKQISNAVELLSGSLGFALQY